MHVTAWPINCSNRCLLLALESPLVYDEKFYEVEDILRHKPQGKGTYLFFTKWLGYPDSESTWEPKRIFQESLGAKKILESYILTNNLDLGHRR